MRLHVLPVAKTGAGRAGLLPCLAGLSLLLMALPGCVTVQPWQREHLAAPCMEPPFAPTAMVGEYRDKVVQCLTGGGLPGGAPGGGCGCTQ